MENYLDKLLDGPIPRERSFPPEEYANRLSAVREKMAQQDIEVLLVHSAVDLCYLTGYQTLWPDAYTCLVLPLNGKPFMQLGEIEASCAVLHGDIEDLEIFDWVGADAAPLQLSQLLKKRGYEYSQIGVQSGRIEMGNRGPVDARLMDILRENMSQTRFVDASLLIFSVRQVKSNLEIEYLREAARISTTGIRAAIAAIEPGKSENDIAAIAAETMISEGSEFFPIDPIVNAGHRTGYFHTTFKRYVIAEGDPVQLEFGGCYHRYTAPQMRTVLTAKPSELQQRVIDVQLTALEGLYSAVKAGRTACDVASEINVIVQQLDHEIFRSGHFGYSVGLGFPPTWTDGPAYISSQLDFELQAGMVFHTPLSFRVPKQFVIGTSETILVTGSGCEVLTSRERDVTVK